MTNRQSARTFMPAAIGARLLLTLLTLGLLLATPSLRAEVRASLDRSDIHTGDTVTLSIETSGDDEGQQPDLAPLQSDFDILGTSSSRQIQIINGRHSDKHQWLIELAPKHTGAVIVPALKVGKSRTRALHLSVSEQQTAAASQAGQAVLIKSEITPTQGDTYVQQQVLYTTRLYYRVPLIEGDFSDPQLDDAVVERLGDDRQYQTTLNGRHYQVLERRYAIFPEHSGKLNIPATIFTGRTVSASSQRSSFGNMDAIMQRMLGKSPFNDNFFAGTPFGDPGKRVRLRSDAVSLDIKPRPAAFSGHDWLPSQQLVLHDSWEKSPPEFRTGEPVTRTITLEAKGLEASQLPTIAIPDVPGVRLYPEQPVQTNRTDGDWVYGRSEQTVALVATKPGKLTLPAVHIAWWDSIKQQQQTAELPAWEVMVQAGSGATAPTAPTTTANTPQTPTQTEQAKADHADDAIIADQTTQQLHGLQWLAVGAAGLLVLLLVLYAVRRRKPVARAPTQVEAGHGNAPQPDATVLRQARRSLQNACAENDSRTAAQALLQWAAANWPQQPPRSLGALAARVERGGNLIRELDRVLYAQGDSAWTGQPLWQAFVDGLQPVGAQSGAGRPADAAPPLYPDWTQKAG